MSEWKHVVYDPAVQTIGQVIADHARDDLILRYVVPASVYEVVAVFGPPLGGGAPPLAGDFWGHKTVAPPDPTWNPPVMPAATSGWIRTTGGWFWR